MAHPSQRQCAGESNYPLPTLAPDTCNSSIFVLWSVLSSITTHRENVSDLLLDANTTYAENDCDNFDELHHRSTCMQDLSNGMVEVVFHKYSTVQSEKLTFPEFCEFVRHEDCVRRLVWLLPSCLGERVGSASSVD